MSIIDELIVKMECKAQVIVLEMKRKRLENKLREIKRISGLLSVLWHVF